MEPLGAKPGRLGPSTRQRKRLQSCSDTESCASASASRGGTTRRKRSRRAGGPGAAPGLCAYDLSLYVRWHSATGGVKVNRLALDPISSVDDLRGLFRRLIKGAFGSPDASAQQAPQHASQHAQQASQQAQHASHLPDYLTCESFYKFSPAHELICSLPGDIARTEFRLVVTLDNGWEYTVCERELPGTPDPERRLLVTLAEFESDAIVVDGRRYCVRLLSYPTVCVKRSFLDGAVAALAMQAQQARAECGASGSGAAANSADGQEGEVECEEAGSQPATAAAGDAAAAASPTTSASSA